ncbi:MULTISPECIES: aromatic ring-hydroxylating oxygenase subunit alpha [unclassified Pseudomonas]|uniref:aromatic ring-hydroxylating oxygenase subunit alpha n=1 Tax=unclassified Pseudomonas TaxID=196821 RepID=UPI000CD19B32|nr:MULTISPECIES: aromatic ring-hydroxylating dioxygenase subunit alpha [unclassified Pseudomonas]POA52555.1 aromatic ring-hydroxylating dioxygenase subunit alpha [Pseudomonas sp. FW507-12TSA]
MFDTNSAMKAISGFHRDPFASYTLPSRFYTEQQCFDQELQKIFGKTWQYVCHVSRLANPGDFMVRDIGRQSALVLRDQEGRLQGFHNVCQHRAHRLCEGRGKLPGVITCPYHAWVYDTGGQLLSARKSEHVKDFAVQDVHLAPVRTEIFCGFVFVNFDPDAVPMGDLLQGMEASVRAFANEPEKLVQAYSREYPLAANWKVSVENYSECYHCPSCHRSLSTQTLDLKSYRLDIHEHYHSHVSQDSGAQQGYTMNEDAPNTHQFGAWYLWPNFCLEVYPGGYMNVLHHLPVAVDRTVQVVEWFCNQARPSAQEQEIIDFVAVIREEDVPLCASVQQGLNSDGYQQGRLVIDPGFGANSEHAVHDIQKRTLQALGLL